MLDSGAALWACWTYIELNPMRAGMVADPADYRFSSYGHWMQTGRHPFSEALLAYMRPALPIPLQQVDLAGLRRALQDEFAHAQQMGGETETATASGDTVNDTVRRAPPFTLNAGRRVRYWVDGLVIGSELFVRETMRRFRTEGDVARHRMARAFPEADAEAVFCWRRLRLLQN